MSDFITILKNTAVASTETGIRITDKFKNISGGELLEKLKQLPRAIKMAAIL